MDTVSARARGQGLLTLSAILAGCTVAVHVQPYMC